MGVANGKVSATQDTTASVTTKGTSTITTSFQVQQGEQTFGTANYFAPVSHDYDIVWVWLNPAVIFTLTPNFVIWNGYGYDTTDQESLDIVGIELGYLNGDFGAMPPDIQVSLNRTWAEAQLWPTGQGPALTSADLAQIASADPFSVSTYGANYLGYEPPSTETADHRFTPSGCSASSSFNYIQASPSQAPGIGTCTLTYANTSTQAQDVTNSNSVTFSVDASVSASFIASLSVDFKQSNTITWTTEAQTSSTNSATNTASLSVQPPPCNNAVAGIGPCIPVYDSDGSQPTQFEIYQDNLYGTFMFAPVHYY